MMHYNIKVKNNKQLPRDAIDFIKNNSQLVGIPQNKASREKDGNQKASAVTNAELLYIHTNGSPARNIPARPVIEPAIENSVDKLVKRMKIVFQMLLDGNITGATLELDKTGMYAQNIVRNWFVDPLNHWAPNSPSVIAAKRRKGATDPKPLIDTGELRKSITYVIRRKDDVKLK
jgi:hypothetical protein